MPTSFTELPLLPSLLQTLDNQGLTTLTEIQALILPKLLDRGSVAAVAETGSGKTLCYVLPVLDRLKRLEEAGNASVEPSSPRALILVPTRELGDQVLRVLKTFTHETRLRVRGVFGGQALKKNRENVSGIFEILVATPGRAERLFANGELSLEAIRFIILDEADQLLDLGFFQQVIELVHATPSFRQVGLFSATLSPRIEALGQRIFRDAEVVQTDGREKLVPTLQTRHVDVPDGQRLGVLLRLLAEPVEGGTMLFANTREQCDQIAASLGEAGYAVVVHRGESPPGVRKENLRAFRALRVPLLVTTDIGSRGLDIDHVGRVINVHLPSERENYLHRVGRTARAGRVGVVINLVTPRDQRLMVQLQDGHQAPRPVRLSPRRSAPEPAPEGPRRADPRRRG